MPINNINDIYFQIILDTFSGEIFQSDYFTNTIPAYKSQLPAPVALVLDPAQATPALSEEGPIENPIEDLVTRLKPLIQDCKNHIINRNDVIYDGRDDLLFSNSTSLSLEDILPNVIQSICRIYEIEISLFDEKKTHYELQSLQKELSKYYQRLTGLFGRFSTFNGYQEIENLSKAYIAFLKSKSDPEWTGEESFFLPYASLVKIDRILNPDEKAINKTHSHRKDKIKKLINEYYQSNALLGVNLITARSTNQDIDYQKVKMVDIYLYYGYVKNYQYAEKDHLRAYNEMKIIYESYFEDSHSSIPTDEIEKRIYLTNRIYFANYLISTLASAFLNDNSIKRNKEGPDSIIGELSGLIEHIEPSYFTHHKLARLYLHMTKYFSELGGTAKNKGIEQVHCFEKAEGYLKDVKLHTALAMKKYNTPGGSLLRFYPDISLIKESKIFSLTGFCKSHGGNFNARILNLQFDINNISIDFFNQKQKSESKEIVRGAIEESEKNISKNNIEILSIFSAIVIFASGNIQIYQYIGSLKGAIVFMVGFSLAISFFVVLLRGKDKILLWIVGLLLLCSGIYLYFGNDYPQYNKAYLDYFKDEIFNDLKEKKDLPANIQRAIEASKK